MQNDENTLDTQEVQEESETEVVAEETTPEVQEPKAPEPKEEGVKLSPAEYRHFKKWQDSKNQPVKTVTQQQQTSPQNIEETVLMAQGMPEELIASLKKVAQVEGINSLIKAQTNPIFVAVREKFEKDLKQKQASMPASRSTGAVKPQKSLTTPGLSRDEHKKLALEKLN